MRGAERLGPEAFERELLGPYAAWQVGLHAVEPVAVQVSAAFVESLVGHDGWRLASRSVGLNVGSLWERMPEFVPREAFSMAQQTQIPLIFAFDVLTQNPDRRAEKPNMLTDGERILLLDHELAFSFMLELPFLRNPTPWQLTAADEGWIRNHYFYPWLRSQRVDFAAFAPALQRLDADFWAATRRHVPAEWQTTQGLQIEQHITQVLSHVEHFTAELTRITR